MDLKGRAGSANLKPEEELRSGHFHLPEVKYRGRERGSSWQELCAGLSRTADGSGQQRREKAEDLRKGNLGKKNSQNERRQQWDQLPWDVP